MIDFESHHNTEQLIQLDKQQVAALIPTLNDRHMAALEGLATAARTMDMDAMKKHFDECIALNLQLQKAGAFVHRYQVKMAYVRSQR